MRGGVDDRLDTARCGGDPLARCEITLSPVDSRVVARSARKDTHAVPARAQACDHRAAEMSGTTGYEDVHVALSVFSPFLRRRGQRLLP
jgi:hypothetical protein